MLTTVEKVIFLQDIDFFEFTQTEDLAYIASITEEVRIKAGSIIYKEGESSDSMYLVLEGRVRLHRGGNEIMVAQSKDIFGTWALFDDEPRVATAVTLDDTTLLRISKEDFLDLLSDHTNITESVFKSLVKKIRSLIREE
ncbi:MAG TPA: cyclic nucleotide-binding domain-containing protein [Acidobacteriota bacterium]|nr:cyclic nucleotide-binding domain-containing protein [Acidobacteriota bacterium]